VMGMKKRGSYLRPVYSQMQTSSARDTPVSGMKAWKPGTGIFVDNSYKPPVRPTSTNTSTSSGLIRSSPYDVNTARRGIYVPRADPTNVAGARAVNQQAPNRIAAYNNTWPERRIVPGTQAHQLVTEGLAEPGNAHSMATKMDNIHNTTQQQVGQLQNQRRGTRGFFRRLNPFSDGL